MKKAEGFYQRKRFGRQERVRNPHRWKVTHMDGKINHVVAADSMNAVKEARKLHTISVQRVQDLGEEPMKHVILEKSQVQPFSRVVMGKFQRVKGWLMPEKYKKEYTPTTRGVMDYVKDHIGIQGYTDIIKQCALESTYIMEGVQSAFLDVTNKGRGTLEKIAKTNPENLKPFLGAIFNHVQEDVVALRRDLRKSRTKGAKDIVPRKRRLEEAKTKFKELSEKRNLLFKDPEYRKQLGVSGAFEVGAADAHFHNEMRELSRQIRKLEKEEKRRG